MQRGDRMLPPYKKGAPNPTSNSSSSSSGSPSPFSNTKINTQSPSAPIRPAQICLLRKCRFHCPPSYTPTAITTTTTTSADRKRKKVSCRFHLDRITCTSYASSTHTTKCAFNQILALKQLNDGNATANRFSFGRRLAHTKSEFF